MLRQEGERLIGRQASRRATFIPRVSVVVSSSDQGREEDDLFISLAATTTKRSSRNRVEPHLLRRQCNVPALGP
jgi:hypothetical protein